MTTPYQPIIDKFRDFCRKVGFEPPGSDEEIEQAITSLLKAVKPLLLPMVAMVTLFLPLAKVLKLALSKPAFPSADESENRLTLAGWVVREEREESLWRVVGYNGGDNRIEAEGVSREQAWWTACEQAAAVAMIDRSMPVRFDGNFETDTPSNDFLIR